MVGTTRSSAGWQCFSMHILRSRRSIVVAALVSLSVGCSGSGPQIAPVSGRITLDGRPLSKASITFQPAGKSPGIGRTDDDGRYEIAYKRGVMGAPIGVNRISIEEIRDLTHRPQSVPVHYNTESDLQREVKAGPNEFDFDLTTK
jgi:hypothetical protein